MGQADTDALLEAEAKWKEEAKGEPPTKWCDRSRFEYQLRVSSGTGRVLMERICDEQGLDHKGYQVPWQDIATFGSYNDAERVLRKLQA